MVMAYPTTDKETPPLPVQVFLAWHGIREKLANVKFSNQYHLAVARMKDYASIHLGGGAMEQLGVILLANKDKNIRQRLTAPGPNGETPPFTDTKLDMRQILWFGVQLGGSPRLFYNKKEGQPLLSFEAPATSPLADPFRKEGYVTLNGPALQLPELPTDELLIAHGDTIGALSRMALICFAAGKITPAKWARQHGKIVEAETFRHAVHHEQVNFLKQISVAPEDNKTNQDALAQLDLQLLTARDRKQARHALDEDVNIIDAFHMLLASATRDDLTSIINELAQRKDVPLVPSAGVPAVEAKPAAPAPRSARRRTTKVSAPASAPVAESQISLPGIEPKQAKPKITPADIAAWRQQQKLNSGVQNS